MAGPRTKHQVRSRRRREDEGDDEGTWASDTQSEASIITDVDAAADADDSELSSELERTTTEGTTQSAPKSNGVAKGRKGRKTRSQQAPAQAVDKAPANNGTPSFGVSADTAAMMNGLEISDNAVNEEEALDFETMGQEVQSGPGAEATSAAARQPLPVERRRREHEEYRKKRDADPAFIPNRGAFFMHDHRSAAPGQNGFRPFGRGRGRGRGAVAAPFPPGKHVYTSVLKSDAVRTNISSSPNPQAALADNTPWAHDLHETILDEPKPEVKAEPEPQLEPKAQGPPPEQAQQPTIVTSNPVPAPFKPPLPAVTKPVPPAVRNFNVTKHVGNAQVRVFLPGMKEPITFSGVPIKSHTRLPNHRPPLRRDKPVRISLPDRAPMYIFPHTDRSFIFIPRALRPNQQGFGRGRTRGFGSLGGFSSRRTSAYGGSVYSPSVAMSRRSSLAREVNRESLLSPGGSVVSRAPGNMDQGRPVVRLPSVGQYSGAGTPVPPGHVSGPTTPGLNFPQQPPYPLPQKPALRENWSSQPLTMHQPRPQKPVSAAGFEAPFQPPQPQEQQPFSNQLPPHITNGLQTAPSSEVPTFYPQNRHMSYPSQGTPLSNIPERAIHAPAFNPYAQQTYPQNFAPQPAYFYPNGAQYPVMQPVFVPNQGFVPPQAPAQPAQSQPMPVEQNGMVYYMDPQALAAAAYTTPGAEGAFGPGQYAMQPVQGVAGGDGGAYYYPPGFYQ